MKNPSPPTKLGVVYPSREIPLTKGKIALIDEADFDVISKYKWYAKPSKGYTEYAFTTVALKTDLPYTIRHDIGMHGLILKKNKGQHIDHINGDGLDNRRSNLRLASVSQNAANVGRRSDNKSGYKGVCWSKKEKCWRASIQVNKAWKHIGYFPTAKEAAINYNLVAAQSFGEFAWLNPV